MVFGKDNDRIEKLLETDTRIWTPDEFFYEFSDGIYNLDLFDDTFLESANENEMMNESLALFGLLGIQHLVQKKAIDFFARKYKFAAMSSAMIWMKKMGITTRANVGGSVIKIEKEKTTKNPKANDMKFRDFYQAILDQRKNENSVVQVVTKDTNTYSWQVFADVNKQQSGDKLVFHIDNDADPMGKPISSLTVRVEYKGKEISANLQTKKATGTGLATTGDKKQTTGTDVATTTQNKEVVAKESFQDYSFLQYLIEAEAEQEQPQGSMVTILDTKNRQALLPYVSLALSKDGKIKFGFDYFIDCITVFEGKNIASEAEEETKEDKKVSDLEKKSGKRKSRNKLGQLEMCWEVDFYGNVLLQGKASILSRLTNVLFGGIKGGVGYTAMGGADTLGAKTFNKGKLQPMTPFKFGVINGNFVIPPVKLKTMYNFPSLVKGDFEAQGNLLQNCAWCPVVKRKLDLTDNKLNSIWGIQPSVNREIILSNNPMVSLTNKNNVPKWTIDSAKYLPTSCENFDLSGCANLVDIKGIPKDVTDTLDLSYTAIEYQSLSDLRGLKTEKLDLSYCESLTWPKEKEEEKEGEVNKEEPTVGAKDTGKDIVPTGAKATGTNIAKTGGSDVAKTTDKTVPVKRQNP